MTETVSIEGIVIDENDVLSIEDRGGWNAPSKRSERGFEYDSYIDAEPVEVTIEALVERERYEELSEIRNQSTPIDGASIGQVVLQRAKLDALETVNESIPENLVRVSIQLSEIQEAKTETATVQLDLDNEQATAAEDTDPSGEQTDSDAGEDDADADEQGFLDGIAESIDDITEKIAGTLTGGD